MAVETDMETRPRPNWTPLAFAVAMVAGVWIGMGMDGEDARSALLGRGEGGRLAHILDRIEATYVALGALILNYVNA